MATTTRHLCECDSFSCSGLFVELPLNVAQEILQNGWIVIVDGCKIGLKANDTLVEKREGYSVYKPND